MRRALVPFLVMPPLALVIVGLLGSGAAAAAVGLVAAGVSGGAGAWFAFRGRPKAPPVLVAHTAAGFRVVRLSGDGRQFEPAATEAELVAHVR